MQCMNQVSWESVAPTVLRSQNCVTEALKKRGKTEFTALKHTASDCMMSGLVSDVSRSHDQPNNNPFLNVFLKIFEIVGLWSYL